MKSFYSNMNLKISHFIDRFPDLKNILHSGFEFTDEEQDLKFKYVIYNVLLLGALMTIFFFFSFDLIFIHSKYLLVEFFSLLIFSVTFYLLRKTDKYFYETFANIILIFFLMLVIFASYTSIEEPIISNWYMATILPIAYLFGVQVVFLVFVLFTIVIVHINYFILKGGSAIYIYSEYIPMLLATWFVYLYNLRLTYFAGTEKKVLAQTSLLEQERNTLEYQAHHDNLTGLPNRVKLNQVLKQYIGNDNMSQKSLAMLFIDLDRFKKINDSFGHDVGDKILKATASRFLKLTDNDTHLFRLGGDEFIILVENFSNDQELMALSQALVTVAKDPFMISNDAVFLSCSIGISVYPEDAKDEFELMKHADVAMFEGKKQSNKRYCFYSEEMREEDYDNVMLESEMHYALDNREFELYYQPQVDIKDDVIVGAEVLVRWNHKRLGLLMPGKFLENAENSSLITMIDTYIFEEGMKHIVACHKEGMDLGRISFNISIKSLEDEKIVTIIENLLKKTGCKGEWIGIEILENDIMFDIEKSIKVLNNFKRLGILISLDDFGVGYSSLSYLRRLPIDKIKVDRSFVTGILTSKQDAAVVNAIIAISKNLDVDLIIEGVETVEQSDYFYDIDCQYIQGNYYYKPMSLGKYKAILQERRESKEGK